MSESDSIDYGLFFQDALRGLVRRSLQQVADHGMPGEHHFYITFETLAEGVFVPSHLLESYPEQMTIVLKTQFHDLEVGEDDFSVGLYFSGVRYDLTIPFESMISFSDPSVGFQLSFQQIPGEEERKAEKAKESAEETEAESDEAPADNVVSLAGFRKKR